MGIHVLISIDGVKLCERCLGHAPVGRGRIWAIPGERFCRGCRSAVLEAVWQIRLRGVQTLSSPGTELRGRPQRVIHAVDMEDPEEDREWMGHRRYDWYRV